MAEETEPLVPPSSSQAAGGAHEPKRPLTEVDRLRRQVNDLWFYIIIFFSLLAALVLVHLVVALTRYRDVPCDIPIKEWMACMSAVIGLVLLGTLVSAWETKRCAAVHPPAPPRETWR